MPHDDDHHDDNNDDHDDHDDDDDHDDGDDDDGDESYLRVNIWGTEPRLQFPICDQLRSQRHFPGFTVFSFTSQTTGLLVPRL